MGVMEKRRKSGKSEIKVRRGVIRGGMGEVAAPFKRGKGEELKLRLVQGSIKGAHALGRS